MKNGCKFQVDYSDFDNKFDDVTKRQIPRRGHKALGKVGVRIISDGIEEEPRAPHKTGLLWRSKVVNIWLDKFTLEVGFNTEYAAAVHEMPSSYEFTLPGSGPKFLESKITKNRDKYIAMLAEELRG
ncbi:MAG TPA: hypothetical protein VFG01_03265 [Acidobacteriota bacterium]|nr:hypothetical protein [Acidobacteriota bacterium]